jgi:ribosomal protein S27AE
VAYLVLAFSFALAGGLVGKIKGSSFFIWFLISGILPVIGLAAALLYRVERDELRRQCPGCGKIVKLHDAICMRCGTELDFPDFAIEPESAASAR